MKTVGRFVDGSFGHYKAADLTVSRGTQGIAIAGPTRAVLLLSLYCHFSAQLDLSGLHPF